MMTVGLNDIQIGWPLTKYVSFLRRTPVEHDNPKNKTKNYSKYNSSKNNYKTVKWLFQRWLTRFNRLSLQSDFACVSQSVSFIRLRMKNGLRDCFLKRHGLFQHAPCAYLWMLIGWLLKNYNLFNVAFTRRKILLDRLHYNDYITG